MYCIIIIIIIIVTQGFEVPLPRLDCDAMILYVVSQSCSYAVCRVRSPVGFCETSGARLTSECRLSSDDVDDIWMLVIKLTAIIMRSEFRLLISCSMNLFSINPRIPAVNP